MGKLVDDPTATIDDAYWSVNGFQPLPAPVASAVKIEVGFDLASNGIGDFFTLSDPAKGALDSTSFVLAGDVLYDLTGLTREVTVRRGRSRTLEKFTAGLAQVVMDNRVRLLDPSNTDSPFTGSIVPRKQVSISRDGKPIYTGNVEGWSWDYDLSGDATAEVRVVDGFASLAQADMTAGTAPGTTPGARIGTALTYAGWPTAARALATGNATLDSDVIADGTNVLQYIQKVEQSEPGAFFMSRDGIATFLSRADLQNPTSGNVTFGSGGVPVVEFAAASLTDEMKNAVAVTYTAGSVVGGTATATDATSAAAYGQFDYSLDTVLSGNLQAQRLADWLVASYKDPKYRIDSITVLLDSLTTMQQGQVLDLELGDVVTVAMSLPNINAVGTAVSQLLSIDAIEHQISVDRHFVTFTMSETTTGFVLDSATFGVLNTSKLGF